MKLIIKLQRFYLYCASGIPVAEAEYASIDGPLVRGNELATSTAFDLLFEIREQKPCPNLKFDRVMDGISEMLESSLSKQIITAKQAWHIEYYLVEFDHSVGRLEKVKNRLERSIQSGNVKAEFYAQDVLRNGLIEGRHLTPFEKSDDE